MQTIASVGGLAFVVVACRGALLLPSLLLPIRPTFVLWSGLIWAGWAAPLECVVAMVVLLADLVGCFRVVSPVVVPWVLHLHLVLAKILLFFRFLARPLLVYPRSVHLLLSFALLSLSPTLQCQASLPCSSPS